MQQFKETDIYKEMNFDTPFPSAEGILAEEIAGIMKANRVLYGTFRNNFRINAGGQDDFFSWYYNMPDGLVYALLYGGTGSGKTTAALGLVHDILLSTPGAYGIVTRKTYSDIEDALIPTIDRFHQDFNIQAKLRRHPAPTYFFPNGSRLNLRSEVKSYRSKQGIADSLGSTEYSVAYLNEGDHQSRKLFDTLPTRMRQRKLCGRPVIMVDCNPPDEQSWVYRHFFVENNPEDPQSDCRAFFMDITENVVHLGSEYINNLKKRFLNHPTLYRKFVEGRFGASAEGDPYFGGIFSMEQHVAEAPLKYKEGEVMCRGWDFGWVRPSCVILQDNYERNRINVFYASLGDREFLVEYCKRILRYCDRRFPGARWADYCDATGNRPNDVGKTQVNTLRELGLRPEFRYKGVDYGLEVITTNLVQLSSTGDSRPVLQFCPEGAIHLIDAFNFGYTQEIDKFDRTRPHKDGTHDHMMDALRYIMIHIRSIDAGKKINKRLERNGWRKHKPHTVSPGRFSSNVAELRHSLGVKASRRRAGGYNFGKSSKENL